MRYATRILSVLMLVLSLAASSLAAPAPSSAPGSAQASKALAQPSAGGKVDLNSATTDELATLKGIGPSKAQAIVQYRADHGGFGSVDELLNVRGIGQKMLEKLRDSFTIVKK